MPKFRLEIYAQNSFRQTYGKNSLKERNSEGFHAKFAQILIIFLNTLLPTLPTLSNHYPQSSASFHQTSSSLTKQGWSKRKPCELFDHCCLTWMAWAPGAPCSHGFFFTVSRNDFTGGPSRGASTGVAPGSFFQKEGKKRKNFLRNPRILPKFQQNRQTIRWNFEGNLETWMSKFWNPKEKLANMCKENVQTIEELWKVLQIIA